MSYLPLNELMKLKELIKVKFKVHLLVAGFLTL